jgi:hypothetical protein
MASGTPNTFSAEMRDRAMRPVQDHAHEYPSRRRAIVSTSSKIGRRDIRAGRSAESGTDRVSWSRGRMVGATTL